MRLVDDLAARRLLYPRPLPTMPDLLVIDIPPIYVGPGLPLGRYYPVILETEAEHAEMIAFLEQERPVPVPPALLDRRLSGLRAKDIVFARYLPTCFSWPWLLLCRWPAEHVAIVPQDPDHFARGVYTIDLFETAADLEEAEARLLDILGHDQCRPIAPISAIEGRA